MTHDAALPLFPFPHGPEGTPPPEYAQLRKEQPVCPVRQPSGEEAWLVTRYDDIAKIMTGPFSNATSMRSSDASQGAGAGHSDESRAMLWLDPPEHGRVLKVLKPFFSARGVEQWRGVIDSIVRELIDDLVSQGPPVDLCGGYTKEIPRRVLFELFGIRGEDAHLMRGLLEPETDGSNIYDNLGAVTQEIEAYFAQAITVPGCADRSPILARMLAAREAGDLTTAEVVQNSALLLLGGIETTVVTLTAGIFHLFRHPDQLRACVADPQLWSLAVEEMARYTMNIPTPVPRTALEEVEISGVTIHKGETVIPHHVSAGWDERYYAAPHLFDINRERSSPLYFGHGTHFCIGAPLARMEMTVALKALFDRLPTLHPAVELDEIQWQLQVQSLLPTELPVSW